MPAAIVLFAGCFVGLEILTEILITCEQFTIMCVHAGRFDLRSALKEIADAVRRITLSNHGVPDDRPIPLRCRGCVQERHVVQQ